MTKFFFFFLVSILGIAACKTSSITSTQSFRNADSGWPTILLYKDSMFSFNYVVPNRFNHPGNPLYPENYFITKGHWKIKKGIIVLTSSSDSLAHNIESSHPLINPFVRNSTNPNFSTFVFSDIWGDTVKFNQVRIDNTVPADNNDTVFKVYKIDLTTKTETLTFYFQHYKPYTFRNSEKTNKDYDITLQPRYSNDFFKNDSFKITRKKIVDTKRKLELTK